MTKKLFGVLFSAVLLVAVILFVILYSKINMLQTLVKQLTDDMDSITRRFDAISQEAQGGVPVVTDSSYTAYENTVYGSESGNQTVDIYVPLHKNTAKTSGILMIHGGGWEGGDKSSYTEGCRTWAEDLQIVTATMNYRLTTENADCADMLADITSAITTMKETAQREGLELQDIILMGHSAGGHLSALYSLKYADTAPVPIALCVPVCGPMDLSSPTAYLGADVAYSQRAVSALCGTQITVETMSQSMDILKEYSPITYISANTPPMLMAHGEKDETVPYENAVLMKTALENAGIDVRFFTFPNSGHDMSGDPDMDSLFFAELYEMAREYCEAF